ncbi:MAG: hypothetical protein CME62_16705 [Halobacteriovoraceae bacterium]|nr:hypothetical protein [Halobacteriovoraceae bacterium]|tara:strand:+ start:24133 stop:24945 length:813 start_codon:yes stop_codon:yes gene_type:complete
MVITGDYNLEVYFVIAQPIGKTKKFKLTEGEYVVIGRSQEHCQVILSDEMASQKHCKVSFINNCIYIEDAGSKNGIYLNGLRVLKQRLFLDDKLKIGDSVMYILQERLSEESKAYLTYSGKGARNQGGYTIELDKRSKNKSSKSIKTGSLKSDIQQKYIEARKKAYAEQRASRNKGSQKKIKSQSIEFIALLIDLSLTLIVFVAGFYSSTLITPEVYNEIASAKLTTIQFILHPKMSTWLFGSFIIAAVFFSINRTNSKGSIGENILGIA